MSTLGRHAPRTSNKRPSTTSPPGGLPDPTYKRQKTVRKNTSTTGLYHPLSSLSSPPPSSLPYSSSSPSTHVSSRLSSQPDSRSAAGAEGALPSDFFDPAPASANTSSASVPTSTSTVLPFSSGRRDRGVRTPPPPLPVSDPYAVDEDEWAAFEADIAATTTELTDEASASISVAAATAALPASAVISAAPTGPSSAAAALVDGLDAEAPAQTEAQLDREEAQNKLVEEFEAMEGLEERVRRLKEMREELRVKAAGSVGTRMEVVTAEEEDQGKLDDGVQDEEDEDEEEEDDWIHFAR